MAPSKSNLMKVGSEGFTMLAQQQQQQYMHKLVRHQPKPHVVQAIVPVPEAKETVPIDCYEAAKFYGGTVVAKYPTKKPSSPQQQQQQQQYMHKVQHQPKPHVVQVIIPVSEAKETVRIDCYEAAKFYGGTVVAEYLNTKKPPMPYMP